jgi:hypothetical protein
MNALALALLGLLAIGQPAEARAAAPPTGVVTERIPHQAGYHASTPQAREWVRTVQEQLKIEQDGTPGTPDIPDRSGAPWLVLIGPPDGTKQVESQLPEELAGRVNVARYAPNDPRLDRGYRQHYQGGTHALILQSDRTVAWSGLVDLAEIVHHLRRLLGLEPDAPPLLPNLPIPLPGAGSVLSMLFAFLGGAITAPVAGLLVRALVRLVVSQARDAIRAAVADAQRQETPRPN